MELLLYITCYTLAEKYTTTIHSLVWYIGKENKQYVVSHNPVRVNKNLLCRLKRYLRKYLVHIAFMGTMTSPRRQNGLLTKKNNWKHFLLNRSHHRHHQHKINVSIEYILYPEFQLSVDSEYKIVQYKQHHHLYWEVPTCWKPSY